MTYILLFFSVLLITSLIIVGIKYRQKGEEELKKTSLRLKWIDQAQFAGFYMARKEGFYAKSGLDVEIYPGGPDISPVQMVVTGANDFGITGADQIILAREKGVPIVAVAVIYKQSPVAIGALKEKNIKSPHDLEGKRMGVVYGRDEEIIYRALLTKEGVDSSKIQEIPVIAGISQITTDKFDAQILYEINEPFLLEQNGFEIDLIKPRDYGINFYADTVFTTEKMVREHPDLVRNFIKASIAGWEKAIENPDSAVEEVMRVNTLLDKQHQTKFFQASISLVEAGEKIGQSEKQTWEEMQEILINQKILNNPIEIDKAFTNEFLD